MKLTIPKDISYRLDVFLRVLAASLGGYVLVNVTSVAIAFMLPVEDDYIAFLAGIQSNFLIYALVIIWAFSATTVKKVWLGLCVLGIPLILLNCYFYFLGATV